MKLLIIRPQPGADATSARVKAAGYDPVLVPLFEIQSIEWSLPDLKEYDALLLTSSNAVRQLGEAVTSLRALPVLCVGSATARAAENAGFITTITGETGVFDLLRSAQMAGHRCLLWLAGEDRVELQPPIGLTLDTRIVYRSVVLPAPDGFTDDMKSAGAILLHSPRAARHFADLCNVTGNIQANQTIAVLSPAIAESAGHGWKSIITATTPNDASLLSALRSYFTNGDCDP